MNAIKKIKTIITFSFFLFLLSPALAQTLSMTNVPGRQLTNLNGKWKAVIDVYDAGSGDWAAYYKDKKPTGNTDFAEYSFDLSPTLNVPGDFNSQRPELTYFESSVWYKKIFQYNKNPGKRLFINFGAVNYKATVYVNGIKLGEHEGGFTPFQFELTGVIKDGENSMLVKVNNARVRDGIPGIGFDWFNYGGITRDVNLIETSETFIEDYGIQLKKDDPDKIAGFIKLNGTKGKQKIFIQIPEKKLSETFVTNDKGEASFQFSVKGLQLWSPGNPKTYKVEIKCETDIIQEEIGFRNIQVKGTDILLNGKPIFLKGVNIHEEIPQRKARAYSEEDAFMLLNWAKELGCNFVRLVHYPHNEHTIRLAEKMGLLVWEELPVYQGIDFADGKMKDKMERMLQEMIQRDRNRCNVIIWSMSNETSPTKERNLALADLIERARLSDSTRLIASAFDRTRQSNDTVFIEDKLNALLDVISINEYYGWYKKWPKTPGELTWISAFNKPLIITEFGGEAMFGNDEGKKDVASTWSEEYQEQIYIDQFKMQQKIPFLKGTCPWVLADFRSPGRNHPKFQNGWNRKGLLSDRGDKKKAWYIVQKFYKNLMIN
ncbi:MAG: glycoside hydrolase family 2 TIM barrel-domain containing protein [Ginsengibacter sp.]